MNKKLNEAKSGARKTGNVAGILCLLFMPLSIMAFWSGEFVSGTIIGLCSMLMCGIYLDSRSY